MEFVYLLIVILTFSSILGITYFVLNFNAKRKNNLKTNFDNLLYNHITIKNDCETLEEVEKNYDSVIQNSKLRVIR